MSIDLTLNRSWSLSILGAILMEVSIHGAHAGDQTDRGGVSPPPPMHGAQTQSLWPFLPTGPGGRPTLTSPLSPLFSSSLCLASYSLFLSLSHSKDNDDIMMKKISEGSHGSSDIWATSTLKPLSKFNRRWGKLLFWGECCLARGSCIICISCTSLLLLLPTTYYACAIVLFFFFCFFVLWW